MNGENKNAEEQYTGSVIQGSVTSTEEVLQAYEQAWEQEQERMIKEAQLQAWEEEEKRIAQMNDIPETDQYGLGELMKIYDEENKYNEYLVHGAILTCSNATTKAFVLPDKKEIVLDHSMDETARCRMALNVEGNHASDNGLPFATVKDTVINENIFPFNCNCMQADVSREEAEAIANDGECSRFGVCRHLMRLNEKWDNMPRDTDYMKMERWRPVYPTAGAADILDAELWESEQEEGITMTSVLFCRRGGLIQAVQSGQKAVEEEVSGISCKALRALMELEVLGPYAINRGYLVIEDDVLIGIRPHLAGDNCVTFGFGDAIQSEEELEYYQSAMGNEVVLSMDVNDYEKIKDIVIPVEICFEKLIFDTNAMAEKVLSDFSEEGYELSQNQLDAIVIAKYQMGTLENKLIDTIIGGAERDELYVAFIEKHGGQGYESRTAVEMNIFFDGNYYVEDGSHDVIVEPLVEYERQ